MKLHWWIALSMLFLQCRQNGCFLSFGEWTKQTQTLTPFHTIIVEDDIKVFLIPDEQYYAEIHYGKNLLHLIQLQQNDSILRIRNKSRCKWMRSYKKKPIVYLHCGPLKRIQNYSSESIIAEDSIATLQRRLDIEIFRSGDVILQVYDPEDSATVVASLYDTGNCHIKGNTRIFVPVLYYSGSCYAMELKTEQDWPFHYGLGDCYIKASVLLGIRHHGKGNLYIAGKPKELFYIDHKGEGNIYWLR